MCPNEPRPATAGPDEGPAQPFPILLRGPVIKGFGRGSKDLGIPTANIPADHLPPTLESGIYYGYAGLELTAETCGLPHDSEKEARTDGTGRQVEIDHHLATADNRRGSIGKGTGKGVVLPMVMSVGWNPFYKNEVRSVEIHIIHKFPEDFYGTQMTALVLGYIRPEFDYVSKEALIDDINTDISVARKSLERDGYKKYEADGRLMDFTSAGLEAGRTGL